MISFVVASYSSIMLKRCNHSNMFVIYFRVFIVESIYFYVKKANRIANVKVKYVHVDCLITLKGEFNLL